MKTSVLERNFAAVYNEVNDFIDINAVVEHRLPAHVPKTDLNSLLLTIRAALLKAAAFDDLTASLPDFDLFRDLAVVTGYSESEIAEFDLRAEGFKDAHDVFFNANEEIEKSLVEHDFVYFNEAGFALRTLDAGDE